MSQARYAELAANKGLDKKATAAAECAQVECWAAKAGAVSYVRTLYTVILYILLFP